MIEKHPFEPFIPPNAKYLLLGSFPGKMENNGPEYDWYFATKRGQFWHILESVYNLNLKSREAKQKLFRQLGMAVTDIILSCERKKGNSSDTNLTNITYNIEIITKIFEESEIQKVYFSSKFVEKHFRKVFMNYIQVHPRVELVILPSPSPRYAKLNLKEKIELYSKVLPLKRV